MRADRADKLVASQNVAFAVDTVDRHFRSVYVIVSCEQITAYKVGEKASAEVGGMHTVAEHIIVKRDKIVFAVDIDKTAAVFTRKIADAIAISVKHLAVLIDIVDVVFPRGIALGHSGSNGEKGNVAALSANAFEEIKEVCAEFLDGNDALAVVALDCLVVSCKSDNNKIGLMSKHVGFEPVARVVGVVTASA